MRGESARGGRRRRVQKLGFRVYDQRFRGWRLGRQDLDGSKGEGEAPDAPGPSPDLRRRTFCTSSPGAWRTPRARAPAASRLEDSGFKVQSLGFRAQNVGQSA